MAFGFAAVRCTSLRNHATSALPYSALTYAASASESLSVFRVGATLPRVAVHIVFTVVIPSMVRQLGVVERSEQGVTSEKGLSAEWAGTPREGHPVWACGPNA